MEATNNTGMPLRLEDIAMHHLNCIVCRLEHIATHPLNCIACGYKMTITVGIFFDACYSLIFFQYTNVKTMHDLSSHHGCGIKICHGNCQGLFGSLVKVKGIGTSVFIGTLLNV
eukprot:12584186-Ditylum_brightwellii.AAC.1